ncbi:hypothetical protein AB0D24_03595 [Streptomyces javensis]|uniref:hypothetical protein n=1 Tax=Streptomyces javensis TaxID=114698 RepID=UPI0033EAB97A
MIDDSIPWREDLLKIADRLKGRKTQKRWTQRTGFLIERDIMLGAYIVRRLNEARKISDELASREFDVDAHALVGKAPDMLTRSSYWESFDLETITPTKLALPHLCNQIIHSYVWSLSVTETEQLLDGLYVCSDHKRRKILYRIPIDSLIELFACVGAEDIYQISMRADANGERQIVSVKGCSALD